MLEALGTSAAPVSLHHDSQPPLGELLLERGYVSEEQLQYALSEQLRTGLPLGQVLISLSYVTASTIAQALATQHGGLLKTEYGFATGFDSETKAGPATVPPLSPMQAPVAPSWIQADAAVPEPAPEPVHLPNPELLAATSRIAELEEQVSAARDASSRIAGLELEIASARQAEQVARQEEQLARQELMAARTAGDELGAAAARVAELEESHAAMRRQLTESMERSEQLERELSELRMGTVDELQRTQHELALTTENLRAAYQRLHEYEVAAAFQQQAAPPARTVSPFAWQA